MQAKWWLMPSPASPPDMARPPEPSATGVPILLSDEQARSLFGVGLRTWLELMGQAWMPQPVTLGPRLRRWVRDELLHAVQSMPRSGRPPEPAQLRRARIERMKTEGRMDAPATAGAARPTSNPASSNLRGYTSRIHRIKG